LNNSFKKTISAVLCAAFLCAFGVSIVAVHAVEPLKLNMEGIVAADGSLAIFCNTNLEEASDKEDFSCTLGNSVLNVLDVTTVAEANAGTSYIFLVDVSGSIKDSHFNSIKAMITEICENLGENDNISIFSLGNETYTQAFVSSEEDIQAQINGIEKLYENTNLYESIFTSLAVLNTHADVHDKKTLVVFSDGEEWITDGITIGEAETKIQESRIPIFTVATLDEHSANNPQDRFAQTATILGSFARRSAGGKHYVNVIGRTLSDEIAADIVQTIQGGLIVSVDLAGFRSNGESMDLILTLDIAGVGKSSDGYPISTALMTTPAAADAQPRSGARESQPSQSFFQKNMMWIAVIGGGAFLIIAAAVILIVVLGRKKTEAVQPAINPTTIAPLASEVPKPVIKATPSSPPPGKPRISLRLVKVGLSEEQIFRAEFVGTLVIGRDSDQATLPFPNDEMLSGRHCSISYEPRGIVVCDLGSTNRTFVNGIPIEESYVLENDDVILIGSMELRVNWEEI
jgi:hypothetical protein